MRTHACVRRRRAVLTALPVALVLLTGCQPDGSAGAARPRTSPAAAAPDGNGITKLSAARILERASEVSSAAPSVRLRGTFREEGKPFTFDLRLMGKRAATGSITVEGQRLGLVRLGSTAYIRGDDRFWKSVGGRDAVRMFHGKYLKTPANSKDFADLMSFTLPSKVFTELLRTDGAVTKGERARVNGRPAITLLDGTGGKVYVATEGEPQILRLSTGVRGEALDFLDYGRKFTVQRPPSRLVIDAGL
jgi:hypothetical protein